MSIPEAQPTHERRAISLFQREIVLRALLDSVKKLDPRVQIRNPVMFVVEIGALITTVTWFIQLGGGESLGGAEPSWFTFTISIWLWLTVVFANMAEAFAEGRGRAQADTLRSMRKETVARMRDGSTKPASELARGDIVVVTPGELIPATGPSSRGSRPSTSRRSRASPPRSSASPAATAAPSRAARASPRTKSSWKSRRNPGSRSWIG